MHSVLHGVEATVSLGEIVEYPGIVKMVDAIDSDGNKVAFVQELSNDIES